jgi:hypothetical protein
MPECRQVAVFNVVLGVEVSARCPVVLTRHTVVRRNIVHCPTTGIFLSYIYLRSSVCLSSCHIPVVLSYSCRPVIFLSYLRNAELFYMFYWSNWPRKRDGGFGDGGIIDGEIGKRQIGEGGCEYTFHCLNLTWETWTFTEPPAVALLNYTSCGILWQIFWQTGIFRGVFSNYHYFVIRISEAAMCGEHYIF